MKVRRSLEIEAIRMTPCGLQRARMCVDLCACARPPDTAHIERDGVSVPGPSRVVLGPSQVLWQGRLMNMSATAVGTHPHVVRRRSSLHCNILYNTKYERSARQAHPADPDRSDRPVLAPHQVLAVP